MDDKNCEPVPCCSPIDEATCLIDFLCRQASAIRETGFVHCAPAQMLMAKEMRGTLDKLITVLGRVL